MANCHRCLQHHAKVGQFPIANIAYVIVGLYAIGLGWQDFRQRRFIVNGYLRQTPAMSFAFGIACCYLGFTSGLFHASLSRFGQQLDVAAMYSPLLMMIAINMGRWSSSCIQSDKSKVTAWAILTGVCIGCMYCYFRSDAMSTKPDG